MSGPKGVDLPGSPELSVAPGRRPSCAERSRCCSSDRDSCYFRSSKGAPRNRSRDSRESARRPTRSSSVRQRLVRIMSCALGGRSPRGSRPRFASNRLLRRGPPSIGAMRSRLVRTRPARTPAGPCTRLLSSYGTDHRRLRSASIFQVERPVELVLWAVLISSRVQSLVPTTAWRQGSRTLPSPARSNLWPRGSHAWKRWSYT